MHRWILLLALLTTSCGAAHRQRPQLIAVPMLAEPAGLDIPLELHEYLRFWGAQGLDDTDTQIVTNGGSGMSCTLIGTGYAAN